MPDLAKQAANSRQALRLRISRAASPSIPREAVAGSGTGATVTSALKDGAQSPDWMLVNPAFV